MFFEKQFPEKDIIFPKHFFVNRDFCLSFLRQASFRQTFAFLVVLY